MPTTTTTTSTEGLRRLLDLIDGDPSLPWQPIGTGRWDPVHFAVGYGFELTDDEVKTEIARIARALPVSKWDKVYDETSFRLYGVTEHGVCVHIYAPRDKVCVRRLVETKTVEVPATEATTRIEEVFEWDCGPLLASVSS